MQDEAPESEQHALHENEALPPTRGLPPGSPDLERAEPDEPTGVVKDAPPQQHVQHMLLPQRGVYYAVIAGGIAGVFTALLTVVVTLVFAGIFQAASQQIAVDRLTVKTALALAGLELLTVMLDLPVAFVVGWIVGRIAVRRRLGFLAGAVAGALFSLITFLVSSMQGESQVTVCSPAR